MRIVLLVSGLAAAAVIATAGRLLRPEARATRTAITDARRLVDATLKDPASARYGPFRVLTTAPDSGVVCGSVNARNGFGAFAGDSRFIARQGTLLFERELTGDSSVEAAAARAIFTHCQTPD